MSRKEEIQRKKNIIGKGAYMVSKGVSDNNSLVWANRERAYYSGGKNLDKLGIRWVFAGNEFEDASDEYKKNPFFKQGCARAKRILGIMQSELKVALDDLKEGRDKKVLDDTNGYTYVSYLYGFIEGKNTNLEGDQRKVLCQIALACLQGEEDALKGIDQRDQFGDNTYLSLAYIMGYNAKARNTIKGGPKK